MGSWRLGDHGSDCTVLRLQILKPAEKKPKYAYGGINMGKPVTPPRKQKKKGDAK